MPELSMTVPDEECHPGLLLEKWHRLWDARSRPDFARNELARVVSCRGDAGLLKAALEARQRAFSDLSAARWTSRTSGPLTLHLSASGSFENAGICLHPVYGFPIIPGTGIKGLARAYATTVAGALAEEIRAVFGPEEIRSDSDAAAGEVVFYDAWPVTWPKLMVDILNNHHREYYEGKCPPVDWEDPVPVHFLAVPAGVEFEFAVAARKPGSSDAARWVELAQGWVEGGLKWLGAGAKTNAGYGRFETGKEMPADAKRAVFEGTLELVSPAFLAGAMQGPEECDLRPATLRGLLRWWWRALHAGRMSVESLRALESALWGDTEKAGAISLEIIRSDKLSTEREAFIVNELIERYRLVRPERGERRAQGILYLGYGMQSVRDKPARHFMPAGAKWRIRFVAKPLPFKGEAALTAEAVLKHGIAALAALAEFGGVGAKSRRGYGSIDLTDASIPVPRDLESLLKFTSSPGTAEALRATESVALNHLVGGGPQEFPLPGNEPWFALDSLGEAYQKVCAGWKHNPIKLGLGLPRNIDGPGRGARALVHPAGRSRGRHASPLLFRIVKRDGKYFVRVTAFIDPHLPSNESSRKTLKDAIQLLGARLEEISRARANSAPRPPQGRPTQAVQRPPAAPPSGSAPLKPGAVVQGELCEEKTKKGGWKAKELESNHVGVIQNSDKVPTDAQPGDRVKLKVKIASPISNLAFEFIPET